MATSQSTTISAPVEYRDLTPIGFPGYRVGDDGSVWSCWRWRWVRCAGCRGGRATQEQFQSSEWKQLKPWPNPKGYLFLTLYANGKPRSARAHQLVALAFLGPRPVGMQVAHENGIPADCRLANLAYKTPTENAADKKRHGTHLAGERVHGAKLTESAVLAIRAEWAGGNCTYEDLATKYGVCRQVIGGIVRGEAWKETCVRSNAPDWKRNACATQDRREVARALLAARGPMTIASLSSELKTAASLVHRALTHAWFARVSGTRYPALWGLTDSGKAAA